MKKVRKNLIMSPTQPNEMPNHHRGMSGFKAGLTSCRAARNPLGSWTSPSAAMANMGGGSP